MEDDTLDVLEEGDALPGTLVPGEYDALPGTLAPMEEEWPLSSGNVTQKETLMPQEGALAEEKTMMPGREKNTLSFFLSCPFVNKGN